MALVWYWSLFVFFCLLLHFLLTAFGVWIFAGKLETKLGHIGIGNLQFPCNRSLTYFWVLYLGY